jgi:hypothetical protein
MSVLRELKRRLLLPRLGDRAVTAPADPASDSIDQRRTVADLSAIVGQPVDYINELVRSNLVRHLRKQGRGDDQPSRVAPRSKHGALFRSVPAGGMASGRLHAPRGRSRIGSSGHAQGKNVLSVSSLPVGLGKRKEGGTDS